MLRREITSLWGVLIFLGLLACEQVEPTLEEQSVQRDRQFRGVNYSQTHLLSEESLDLSSIEANWVALIPQYFGRQGRPLITEVHRWTSLLPEAIEEAQAQGLSVMVKPHIDFNDNQIFRGEFRLDTEEEWQSFEQAYTNRILGLVSIAEDHGVEAFCVGTELRIFAMERAAYWRTLISQIRSQFSGQLVYAANWDEYHEIPFWDQLDYIGVNSYFPLSRSPYPTREELKLGWTWYKDAMQQLTQKTGKPILFTEYGYRSMVQATWKHWEVIGGQPNDSLQALAYEVFFQSFWEEPWVAGGLFWEWVPNPPRGVNTRWTPQGKLAEEVIREWYGR